MEFKQNLIKYKFCWWVGFALWSIQKSSFITFPLLGQKKYFKFLKWVIDTGTKIEKA